MVDDALGIAVARSANEELCLNRSIEGNRCPKHFEICLVGRVELPDNRPIISILQVGRDLPGVEEVVFRVVHSLGPDCKAHV